MFYAQFVLSKKGPLAKIWLAAHWEKKLTKAQVFETNIDKAVESILEPKVKMALRTTGHLLLGVVRIYSRKAKYLLADCNEACSKIKMAFRATSNTVDLQVDTREANLNAITLPEVFHDFDSALPDFNDVEYEQQLAMNQSRIEEITMREDLPVTSSFGLQEEAFGAEDFDSLEINRFSTSVARGVETSRFADVDVTVPTVDKGGLGFGLAPTLIDIDAPIVDDFGDQLDDDNQSVEPFFGAGTPAHRFTALQAPALPLPHAVAPVPPDVDAFMKTANFEAETATVGKTTVVASVLGSTTDVTTLVHNEEESFVLAPVDASSVAGAQGPADRRPKRKRRLVVDELKSISGEEMKAQLNDYSDTVTTLDLAPPTKKLMAFKDMCVADRIFNSTAFQFASKQLLDILMSNSGTKVRREEVGAAAGEAQGLQLGPLQSELVEAGAEQTAAPATPHAVEELERVDGRASALGALEPITEEHGDMGDVLPSDTATDYELSRRLPSVSPQPGSPPLPAMPASPQRSPSKKRASAFKAREGVAVAGDEADLSDDEETPDEQAYLEANPEDKQWSSRTHSLLRHVRSKLKHNDYVNFVDLCARKDSRKIAAQKFYTLLVLKKWRAIDVQQQEPFGDIRICADLRINDSISV